MTTILIYLAGVATPCTLIAARLFWLWLRQQDRSEQAHITMRIKLGLDREALSLKLPGGRRSPSDGALIAGRSTPVAASPTHRREAIPGAATNLAVALATGLLGASAASPHGTPERGPRHRARLAPPSET